MIDMATTTINTRLALKTDISANWENSSLVLLKGEPAIEITDSGAFKFKFGDGVKTFSELPYATLSPTEISSLITDGAVQSVSISSGDSNGQIAITVDGTKTNASVKGLGSAAFTNSNAYATASHSHAIANVTGLQTALDGKAAKSHTHDDRYYTEAEVNTKLAGKANSSHTHGNGDITSLDASKLTGTISIDRLPAGALERCVIVETDADRLKLTTASVQKGDTVKVTGTGKMYLVIDDTKLTSEDGYTVYTAGSATSVPWSGVTGKPSTFTPSTHTHTKSQITDFPTSMPASDVYAWAKAASKPSYSWSEITSKPSTFTPASHTHAYIPLSGGTITGSIIRSSGGSWISARNNVAVRGTATGKDSWNPVVGQATPNGYWTIGNLASNDNLAFSYTSNTNYNAGNNSATTVYLPVQEGTIITSATIGSQSVKYATSAGSAGSVAWGNVSGKPSSYTPSSHTHDDRYYTETEINTKLGAKLGAVSANGYYGMARPDGNTSDWIRTTTAGIIPYQSGGAGGGHCGIGTSSWYFSNAYIDTVNCVNTNASGYLQANGLINTYSEYQSQKGSRDWRFGSATGSGDQNWFGFYDYTYGYHGGIYGPGHSLRMGGEIQSTAANGFRAVQGKYGFIIRNDGANVYFMMTGNGDPWGGWNDNYTIFTPNGEWQVKKSPYDNGMSTARGYVVVSDSNDNRVYSISNYSANYLKVRCGLNTYHCTYSNSDIRLKKNINNTSITNALSVINSIKVRQFDWKETNIHQSIGFVADELEKLDPNFSQGGGVTKDGGIDVKSVNSFYLQGYIVKALQELSSQVSDLKQENKRLKQKLNMCN